MMQCGLKVSRIHTLLKKPFSFREINPLIDDRLMKGFGNL